jgi:hypothetical protein
MNGLPVDRLLDRIERKLKASGVTPPAADVLLDSLNEVAIDVARRGYALKEIVTLTLENGKDTYDIGAPIHLVKYVLEPERWTHRLEITESPHVFVDTVFRRGLGFSQPICAMTWDRYIAFKPTPTVTEELRLLAYLLPPTLEHGGTHPFKAHQEQILEHGVLARNGVDGSGDIYERMVAREAQDALTETAQGTIKRKHWSDALGY